MRTFNRWLPDREAEFLLVMVLHLGLLGLALLLRAEPEALPIMLFTLEVGLPVTLGIVAAGLMANDSILDLLLSVPQPPPQTLAERLTILLGYGLLLAVLALLAARWLSVILPVGGVQALFIWAAPALLFVGLGTVGALMRGRMLDGVMLVLVAGGTALFTLTIQSDCPIDPASACHAALATPLMTLLRPQDPLWLTNRLVWAGIGAALLAVGLGLVRQEERLVAAAQVEE